MNFLNRFVLRVSKNVLLLLAGLVWGFAGFKILSIGLPDMIKHWYMPIFFILMAFIIYFLFTKFVFFKMFVKHRNRIMSYGNELKCIFTFFDIKGYFIMTFMIIFGILLRNSRIVPPLYLGTFYSGLGLSLATASVCFIYTFILIKIKNNTNETCIIENDTEYSKYEGMKSDENNVAGIEEVTYESLE